jgi:hypothetical protein
MNLFVSLTAVIKYLKDLTIINGGVDFTCTIVGNVGTGLDEVVDPLASSPDIASSSSLY